MSEQPENAAAEANNNQAFNIEKIYVKNASLEIPNAPEIFRNQVAPEMDIKIGIGNRALEKEFYDVSITITITANLPENKVLFLAEVVSSGVFLVQNFSEQDRDVILNITCPNILFPFAREAISDLIVRGGFPPVYLNPLNFEAMYQQQQQAKAEQAAEENKQ